MVAARRIAVLGILLALLTNGCSIAQPHQPVRPVAGITDEDRVAAMMSIHAHARSPERDFGDADIMDLKEAIDVLERDEGPAADSRVRRAIAKLWAWGYGRADFETAINRLLLAYPMTLTDLDDELRRQVEKMGGQLPPQPWMYPVIEARISNLLMKAVTTGCYAQYVPDPPVGVLFPPPVAWEYELYVPRKMEDIARTLDPQSWARASKVFQKSYLVDAHQSCCDTKGAPQDCSVTPDPNSYDPMPGSSRAAGQPYKNTAFFESFCGGRNCGDCEDPNVDCTAAFKVLLCAETEYDNGKWVPFQCLTPHADRYDAEYAFRVHRFGELAGAATSPIVLDNGNLSVRRATAQEIVQHNLDLTVSKDWSFVHVDKKMRFKSLSSTISVGIALYSFAAELQKQIAEQVCEDIPKESWCFASP